MWGKYMGNKIKEFIITKCLDIAGVISALFFASLIAGVILIFSQVAEGWFITCFVLAGIFYAIIIACTLIYIKYY